MARTWSSATTRVTKARPTSTWRACRWRSEDRGRLGLSGSRYFGRSRLQESWMKKTTIMSPLSTFLLLASGALLLPSGLGAKEQTVPGELRSHATLHSIGLEWDLV